MLPKANRLTKKKDFERIFKEGRGLKEDFLLLKFLPNNLDTNRFGFVIGQRISKKAVIRNRIKRRLRELVRLELPIMKKGNDIVLLARPGLETKSSWEIKETLNKLFKKARLIIKNDVQNPPL